ncbi:hypothetical protein A2Z00_02270 [Candidatus Gottesmanbacteria bacterium RBG_13_45_10]|uniref:Glycosyl transferase family 1 domain-containing protein n=1 Tax=Candidatus Gottesmanbacteria bacterium RBG_13_45_10 TaxID=1798370 RepID=A0A1F5ZG11_9BACT|nr:MAG: hypothetical protein A2Z00_02270 [Candidatus Gottesmanbacteria bacterium RBG_13_45_10]
MKIGIDARLIGETGVGRYIRNLIRELSVLDKENQFIVFLREGDFRTFEAPNSRWKKRIANTRWHTFSEQIIMPWILMREHLDVLHVPYFAAPIFYPRKYILTIHDLTILHFNTGKASTLPMAMYKVRRLGYLFILTVGVRRASHILTVSHAIKNDIVTFLGVSPDKVSVTYESVDPDIVSSLGNTDQHKPIIEGRYFLYVGNVYPHKNMETFLEGYKKYVETSSHRLPLVIVGKDDLFYRRLRGELAKMKLSNRVQILQNVNDTTLNNLYKHAQALVLPSRMEGFGLPALEALALGSRVLCSDIPVFHEILGDLAEYMESTDTDDISLKLANEAVLPPLSTIAQRRIASHMERFTWKELAQKTLQTYHEVFQR